MIYLDNAATSWPKPREVIHAIVKTIEKYGANPGRSGHKMAIEAGRIILNTREALCELFHVSDPFQFIFCSNCTDALNLAIKGCLKAGDHVITTALEHNSVLRPLKTLEQQGKIKVSILPLEPQGVVSAEAVQKSILPNTRLVVVNHASNVSGAIQPIEEIGQLCRKHHILFLVDGAQTAGILPIHLEMLPIDLFAFPGHKGLFGPQGTGGLYIRPNTALTSLKEGGTGSLSESWYQPKDLPDYYESGTLNTPGIAGLAAGIQFILKNHKELQEKEKELSRLFFDEIREIDGVQLYSPAQPDKKVSVFSFNIRDIQSGMVGDLLDSKYDIACRAGLHCAPLVHKNYGTLKQGAVRISPGFFNSKKDILKCIDAIRQITTQ